MTSATSETWTISERQRLALRDRIQAALDLIPLEPYEIFRRADVHFGVLPSAEVPSGDRVKVTVARFDPSIPGILFFGPYLIRLSDLEIETIAIHEFFHAYRWVMGDPFWHTEYHTDGLMREYGFDPTPLEDVRFDSTGRSVRRFLSVG